MLITYHFPKLGQGKKKKKKSVGNSPAEIRVPAQLPNGHAARPGPGQLPDSSRSRPLPAALPDGARGGTAARGCSAPSRPTPAAQPRRREKSRRFQRSFFGRLLNFPVRPQPPGAAGGLPSTHLGPDLVAALARLDVHDLPHGAVPHCTPRPARCPSAQPGSAPRGRRFMGSEAAHPPQPPPSPFPAASANGRPLPGPPHPALGRWGRVPLPPGSGGGWLSGAPGRHERQPRCGSRSWVVRPHPACFVHTARSHRTAWIGGDPYISPSPTALR